MVRLSKTQWTPRDTEIAAKLELPLLLLLDLEQAQSAQALRDRLGKHEKSTVERGLRHLAGRGLAWRRETRWPARTCPKSGQLIQEKIIRRWVLSPAGKDWRDLRVAKVEANYAPLGAKPHGLQ